MSFPRAKVHRFNDVKPLTPSPAEYDPRIKSKPKGAVIPQSGRFDKSPTRSESGSTKSTPCFRTPILPKKKKIPTSTTKLKLFPTTDNEQLQEKIVECENKDQYIKELTEQMEEINEKVLTLENQKRRLDEEKNAYEHKSNLVKEEFDKKTQQLIDSHTEELEVLKQEKYALDMELQEIKRQYNALKEEQKQDLLRVKEDMCKIEQALKVSHIEYAKEIEAREKQLHELEQEIKVIKEKHATEINNLKEIHKLEIQEMEFEMLKIMSDVQKEKDVIEKKILEMEKTLGQQMNHLRDQFEQEKEVIVSQSEARLQQMEENYRDVNKLVEIQMNVKIEEIEAAWKAKLEAQEQQAEAILKECQNISEYSIIQCELEKNEIKSGLSQQIKQNEIIQNKYKELNDTYSELKLKHEDLQAEFSGKLQELKQKNEELMKEINGRNEELQKIIAEKRAYQITMNTYQETIEVLKKRLFHSDRDVEQLKQEISKCEEKILDHENNWQRLTCELKQQQEYNEELELQYESSLKIYETEINNLKTNLLDKIELYKVEADKHSKRAEIDRKLLEDALSQLKQQRELTSQAHEFIENMKEEIDYIHEENENYLKNKEEYQKQIENLVKKVTEKETLIGHLQEKCKEYTENIETYKSKIDEYVNEMKEMAGIHKKYIEVSGRYDDITTKHEALQQENLTYKNKINKQNQQYEELLKKFKALEEENVKNKQTIKEQRSLIEPFIEQLEQYEIEKCALLGVCQNIDEEARDIKSKYADILGHHNQKQKIKHLESLKEKNMQLLQAKLDLEKQLKVQTKTSEKLKNENGDLKKLLQKLKVSEDKENFGSPNKSLNSNRIESPGPLRERNQN